MSPIKKGHTGASRSEKSVRPGVKAKCAWNNVKSPGAKGNQKVIVLGKDAGAQRRTTRVSGKWSKKKKNTERNPEQARNFFFSRGGRPGNASREGDGEVKAFPRRRGLVTLPELNRES